MADATLTTLWLLHGVNLDMLGQRDPAYYGSMTLPELEDLVRECGEAQGFLVHSFQTNNEGAMVERLHELAASGAGAVIANFGAWTHYSYALRDALELVEAPIAEVHLSDIEHREAWRRTSVIADVVDIRIAGKGARGYAEAVEALAALVRERAR
jgi:3-dehydroquinate dehydratase-2